MFSYIFCCHAVCIVPATRASKHLGNGLKKRPKISLFKTQKVPSIPGNEAAPGGVAAAEEDPRREDDFVPAPEAAVAHEVQRHGHVAVAVVAADHAVQARQAKVWTSLACKCQAATQHR